MHLQSLTHTAKSFKNLLISFVEEVAGLETTAAVVEGEGAEETFFSFDFLSFLLHGKKDMLKNSL